MLPNRRTILVLAGCLAAAPVLALGQAEALRYPVRMGVDGSLTAAAPGGSGSDRRQLPADAPDGYRFSWKGSYYELVTYPSGKYAVLSLDPRLSGRTKGHTLFLKSRTDPRNPIPEWVTDDRRWLTGLSQYSGKVALRVSRESWGVLGRKPTAESVLAEGLAILSLQGIPEPSDADKAAARFLAEDLARLLAPGADFRTYEIRLLVGTAGGSPKRDDLKTVQRDFALAVVRKEDFAEALSRVLAPGRAGGSPPAPSPNGAAILRALESAAAGE